MEDKARFLPRADNSTKRIVLGAGTTRQRRGASLLSHREEKKEKICKI